MTPQRNVRQERESVPKHGGKNGHESFLLIVLPIASGWTNWRVMKAQRVIALCLLVGCGPSTKSNSPGLSTAQATASAKIDPPQPSATASAVETSAPSATASAATPPPPATKSFSLSEFKLPLSIELPVDAQIAASDSKDGLGGATIDAKTVSVRVLKADARIVSPAAAKATLQKLKFKPASKFLKEEPDLLVYERGEKDVNVLFLSKQGGVTYACQSLGGASTEAELAPAMAACKTLKKTP